MKKYQFGIVAVSLVILLLGGVLFSVKNSKVEQTLGAAWGLPATIATSSIAAVSSTASLVFGTSTCASRIITTVASPIMITFSDNQGLVPTATYGHLQAASTTVSYDSSEFGCNAVKVYSFTASTITVSESR